MALTDSWLKAAHGSTRESAIEKADRDGLSVRVSPKGKITWQIRYRYDRKAKRQDLGTYPLMTLKEARLEAIRLRAKLEQGFDPKIVRFVEKKAIQSANTYSELFYKWYESHCVNKKAHEQILNMFKRDVLPVLGGMPARDITLHHWLALLEKLSKTKPATAGIILTNLKQSLKFGVKRQIIPLNPLSDISPRWDLQIKPNAILRSLTDEEVFYVWKAASYSRMAYKNRLFIKLCLLYGCRTAELRLSEKSHFDFSAGVWTVPAENHKTGGKPLIRPIIPEVEPLIREAIAISKSPRFVFCDERTNECMSRFSPTKWPEVVSSWVIKNEKYEIEPWTMHDLRKTARTNFSKLTEPHVAEIMLGHKLPGVWQIYDHYSYLDEQREAYKKWWDRLMKITAMTPVKEGA